MSIFSYVVFLSSLIASAGLPLLPPKHQPQKDSRPVSDGRGAAKGLNLYNMEEMTVGLRKASEPTRNSKKRRDAARFEKMRADQAKAKKTTT